MEASTTLSWGESVTGRTKIRAAWMNVKSICRRTCFKKCLQAMTTMKSRKLSTKSHNDSRLNTTTTTQLPQLITQRPTHFKVAVAAPSSKIEASKTVSSAVSKPQRGPTMARVPLESTPDHTIHKLMDDKEKHRDELLERHMDDKGDY